MDKTPGATPGALVHGSEPDPFTTTRENRNVLTLAVVRSRQGFRVGGGPEDGGMVA